MIRLEEIITLEQVNIIKSFFCKVFPEEPNYDCIEFTKSVTRETPYKLLKCYLCYHDDDDVIGFTGIYADDSKDECWLNWFGIKPEFRRKGYATEVLHQTCDLMRKFGYKYLRLYTDKKINYPAYLLYIKDGFIEDGSYNESGYSFITMSKPLYDDVIVQPWSGGKPLGFESELPEDFKK